MSAFPDSPGFPCSPGGWPPGGCPPEGGVGGDPELAVDSLPGLLSELLSELLSDLLSDLLSELDEDDGGEDDGGELEELGGDELGGVGICGVVGLLALGQPLRSTQIEVTPASIST